MRRLLLQNTVSRKWSATFGRRPKVRKLKGAGRTQGPSGDGQHYLFVYGTLKRGMHWHSKFLSTEGTHFCGAAHTATPLCLTVGNCGVPYLVFPNSEAESSRGTQVHGELYVVSDDTLTGLDDYEGVGKGCETHHGFLSCLCIWTWLVISDASTCLLCRYYKRNVVPVNVNAGTQLRQINAFVYGVEIPENHAMITVPPKAAPSFEAKGGDSRTITESKVSAGHEIGAAAGGPSEAKSNLSDRVIAEYTHEMHQQLYKPVAHILLKQETYLSDTQKYNHKNCHPRQEAVVADATVSE